MFHTYIVSVSSWCCICFTHMLQVFHLDVAYVLQWLHTCFPGVCFKCSGRMLQVFYLDVAKVDLVLHMLQWDPSAAAACCSYWACVHARGCGGGTSGKRGNGAGADWDASPCVGMHRLGKWSGTDPHVKQARACGRAQRHAYLGRGQAQASGC
jgi:hypothetical protein